MSTATAARETFRAATKDGASAGLFFMITLLTEQHEMEADIIYDADDPHWLAVFRLDDFRLWLGQVETAEQQRYGHLYSFAAHVKEKVGTDELLDMLEEYASGRMPLDWFTSFLGVHA